MSRLVSALLGCLAGLVALEIGLRIAGVVFLEREQRRNALGEGDSSVTILCLGESSTALGGEYAYPRQLEALLNEHGPGETSFRVVNGGRPGIDSSVIVRDLGEKLDEWRPDIVTVMMGINDGIMSFVDLNQYQGKGPLRRSLMHLKLYRLARYLAIALGAEDEQRRQARHLEERERSLCGAVDDRGDPLDSIVLAMLYRRQAKYRDAEKVLLELLAREPSPRVTVDLAHVYHDMSRFDEEEALYRVVIARHPDHHPAYRWLIRLLGHLERDDEIGELLRDLVAATPDAKSYTELAKFYRGEGRLDEAESMYREAMKVDESPYSRIDLASMLREMGRSRGAEKLLRKAARFKSGGALAKLELAGLFVETGRIDEAQRLLEALMDNPTARFVPAESSWDVRPYDPSRAALELARLHRRRGDIESARAVIERIAPNPMSLHNYHVLSAEVMAEVGRLVVIQYPVRSLVPLEAMVPAQEGVIFVDNERSFKDAIAREGYNALFIDHFASDFGHTNRKGHALIARNTARVILNEFFGVDDPDLAPPVARSDR